MAATIAPRLALYGLVHRIDNRRTSPDDDGVVREARSVVVLSDGGGFAEVYVGPDDIAAVPRVGEPVAWVCDVSVWNRRTRDGERTYATLSFRFVQAIPADAALSSVA